MNTAATETKSLPSSPLKSDDLGGKASTFFFTNFPENWGEDKLWQEFRKFGTVVDVFVARKRNKVGRMFGFARFMKVRDTDKLEKELNNTWWDRFKLKVNIAKYGRKDKQVEKTLTQKLKSVVVGQEFMENEQHNHVGTHTNGRSYMEAVNRRNTVQEDNKKTKHSDEAQVGNSIHVIPSPDLLERLDRTLIGAVKCYDILKNLHELPNVEGLNDVKVSYYGGMSVLLEFRTKEAAKNYLTIARGTWMNWFRTLDIWTPEMQTNQRLAALQIAGLPPHAWMSCVFSDIGSIWGDIVVPEWCNSELSNRETGKVIILTQVSNIINDTVEVIVENMRFKVMVIEDFKDSLKLGPKLDLHSVNEDDDDSRGNDSDGDDSRGDENSIFESVGDDILDFQVNGEEGYGTEFSGEAPPDRVTAMEKGWNTVVSTPVIGAPEASRAMKECSATPKVCFQDGTHCPSSPEDSRAGNVPISNSVGHDPNYQSFEKMGPSTFSPSHFIPETPPGPPSADSLFEPINSCNVSDTINFNYQNPEIQEDILLEETEINIEMEEEEIDSSTIFWETKANRLKKVKRDLKMKRIQSPCKCRVKIKRNGMCCKHAIFSGDVNNSPIIVSRDKEDSSDSEVLIRNSNTRILKRNITLDSAAKSQATLIAEEVENLQTVGKAIGVDLKGCQEQLKVLASDIGEKFFYG